MESLYAPWRSAYFSQKVDGCVFCNISANEHKDSEHKVFYRDNLCFGVMNKYPYTPGHCMLIPHEHIDSPECLNEDTWLHIHKLSRHLSTALLNGFGAQGVNMGINIKSSAGAGIPEHLHIHFVPRWRGDTNFITTIADTRIYGVDFEKIYTDIKKLCTQYFPKLSS